MVYLWAIQSVALYCMINWKIFGGFPKCHSTYRNKLSPKLPANQICHGYFISNTEVRLQTVWPTSRRFIEQIVCNLQCYSLPRQSTTARDVGFWLKFIYIDCLVNEQPWGAMDVLTELIQSADTCVTSFDLSSPYFTGTNLDVCRCLILVV